MVTIVSTSNETREQKAIMTYLCVPITDLAFLFSRSLGTFVEQHFLLCSITLIFNGCTIFLKRQRGRKLNFYTLSYKIIAVCVLVG